MQTVVDKIAGYEYGASELATSPVTLQELDLLKQTITLDSEDVRYLRIAGEVLEPQTESIVSMWRGVINSMPHLATYFKNEAGKTDETYKARVKERFKQWIMDLCCRPYDQDWLNYQYEIGLRHTSARKNKTDNADAPPFIP